MTGTITIVGEDDADTLAELAAATFTQSFGHLYADEDLQLFLADSHSPEVYKARLRDPAYRIWLARGEGGEAVGYLAAGPCTLAAPGVADNAGEIARFYILPAHQGAGLGSRMLETALSFLRARYKCVYISVYAENYGAHRLYQRHGFVKICDHFYQVGKQRDPEWIMGLKFP